MTNKDKSAANREYYERNKPTILRRAAERRKDPMFNERRKQDLAARSKRLGSLSNKEVARRPTRQTVVTTSGRPVETEMYPIALASVKIGVSRARLHAWIKEGRVPEPRYKHVRKGWLLYTHDEVEIIARVYRKHQLEGGIQYAGDLFSQEVMDRFLALDNGVDMNLRG